MKSFNEKSNRRIIEIEGKIEHIEWKDIGMQLKRFGKSEKKDTERSLKYDCC